MSGIPGDPDVIETVAGELTASSSRVDAAMSTARGITADDWEGGSEEAYRARRSEVLSRGGDLADAWSRGARALQAYAPVLRTAQKNYDDARSTIESLVRRAQAPGADVLQLRAESIVAQGTAMAAAGSVSAAAGEAANRLNAEFPDPDRSRQPPPWWDPFNWRPAGVGRPDVGVTPGIDDPDNFDVRDLNQGQIGDCFLLVGLLGLMNSDDGDRFLQDHIRWDGASGTYVVTLYRDGEPVDVTVDKIYGKGARIGAEDRASVAALYEAAIAKEFGSDYLDGGHPEDAMEKITGKESHSVGEGFWPWSKKSVDDARKALEDGEIAAIYSPTDGDHDEHLTVERPDGSRSTEDVTIVAGHAYQIERIESDGDVWMRNPWGPGNGADGGDLIRVPADMVEDIFGKIVWNPGAK